MVVDAPTLGQPTCPSCGSSGAGFILLRIRGESELWLAGSHARVEIAVSCAACLSLQALHHSYPLNPMFALLDQLRLLEEVLADQTGLPVFREPPDDPSAGVREPRRPLPSAGAVGVQLIPPSYEGDSPHVMTFRWRPIERGAKATATLRVRLGQRRPTHYVPIGAIQASAHSRA